MINGPMGEAENRGSADERMPPLGLQSMNEAQRKAAEELVAGPRGIHSASVSERTRPQDR